jgi:hypothetical protein
VPHEAGAEADVHKGNDSTHDKNDDLGGEYRKYKPRLAFHHPLPVFAMWPESRRRIKGRPARGMVNARFRTPVSGIIE